ncbi:FIG00709965: hypothetical protein [hydrothermal vent metagenome]|uniref:Uncharacterized protein n=1 Tax=hydrothermal vent metagenome TaxID=652676 RepID=A0A3B0W207_9ZZZZ
MLSQSSFYKYNSDGVSFLSKGSVDWRTIYFPLCGVASDGIKSSITPFLCGDIKIDKNFYLTKPVSTEDLRYPVRNFFISVKGKGVVSLVGGKLSVEAGQIWHKVKGVYKQQGIEIEVLNFVPVSEENLELMQVTVRNISQGILTITPTSVIPVFGRALANKHDHEHVTSLLHRTKQLKEGVFVQPTMSFNEEGHKKNALSCYVFGIDGRESLPVGSFPTIDSFYGSSGTALEPEAITNEVMPKNLIDEKINGKEAVGALRFATIDLVPQEERVYVITIGVAQGENEAREDFQKFNSCKKVKKAYEENKKYWMHKTEATAFQTGNDDFNSWMRWVTLQPVLRRIYGCSFLPDHDYGKGGKGWRDIWQDLLSLILIEPDQVREDLINNFAGVRIDGSNATIIGSAPGEFIADRNAIARVWMDHGVWPFMTLLLYVNQTGDYNILFEQNTYFRDVQMSRTFQKDEVWTPEYGNKLKDVKGNTYKGTLIEHVLLQNLVQFFNVGEHNITRLESADWNDGLDMGFDRGESVTFMSAYAGNLEAMAELLIRCKEVLDIQEIVLSKEIVVLLDSLIEEGVDYSSVQAKKTFLFETYFSSVEPEVSGEQVKINIDDVVKDLRKKKDWIFQHIRTQEWITVDKNGFRDSWFNGYYDNEAVRVEGDIDGIVRMTLTGQVFPMMSGVVKDDDVKVVDAAVRRYLQDRKLGGIRLNSNFEKEPYLELGRAFGFAYGTKENGAFFSHMIVMYAYALYSRGLAREGYEVLQSIYNMCIDTQRSKIYPGIPEYFDSEGKGMYHYLTGSASWLVLTQLTQVFGVRGCGGDLVLAPMLVKEEFNKKGLAAVSCPFAGKQLMVIYENSSKKDFGSYRIEEVFCNKNVISFERYAQNGIKIIRKLVEDVEGDVELNVILS